MLFTFKRKPREDIYKEIDEFLSYRKSFIITNSYKIYLNEFVKVTGIHAAVDINNSDMEAYAESLQFTRGSEFQKKQAITAILLFRRHVNRAILGRPMEKEEKKKKLGRPRNEQFRAQIAEKRKEGWTIRKIAIYYNRAASTIHEIIQTQ